MAVADAGIEYDLRRWPPSLPFRRAAALTRKSADVMFLLLFLIWTVGYHEELARARRRARICFLCRFFGARCLVYGAGCRTWAAGQGAQAASYAAKCNAEIPMCRSLQAGRQGLHRGVEGAGGGQSYPIDECK